MEVIMFGNIIYFNKSKIEQYATLLQGEKSIIALFNDKSNNANLLLACSKFEKMLKDRDDFVDFVSSDQSIAINEVKISSIIRAKGEVYVPEQFDMVHLIQEYKSLIVSAFNCKDETERNILKSVLQSSKMRIPIYCELDDECDFWMGICKISPDNLVIDYNDLEDCEGKTFTILAKLEARKYYNGSPLPVFDIYKDFLGLNRGLRRQLVLDKNEPFENISVEEDYLALELLAIY